MLDFIRDLRKSADEKRQETVNAYVDQALSPRQRQQFERELAQDFALQAEVTQLQQLKQNLRRLPRRPARRNFTLDPAVYGAPQTQPLVQLYPAMRVATALTAVFFVIAIVADLLTPGFANSGAAPVALQVERAADVDSAVIATEMVVEEAEIAEERVAGEAVTLESAVSEPATGDTMDAPLTTEMTPALTMPQNGVETFSGETAADDNGDAATSPLPEASIVEPETAVTLPSTPASFHALRFFQTGLGVLLLTLALLLVYTRRQI